MRAQIVGLMLVSSQVAWANPEDVRHPGDAVYASLDPNALRAPSANPLAPPPGEVRASSITVAPPAPLPRKTRRWGLFGAGVALFGVAYAVDAGATYGAGHASASTSLVPLVGPLLQLGQKFSVVSTPMSTGDAQLDAMAQSAAASANHAAQIAVDTGLVIDFALQLAGVALMVAGPLLHTTTRVAASAHGLSVTF